MLATIHRAENTDYPERLAAIVDALVVTGKSLPVLWPLHPRTRAALSRLGMLGELESSVHAIDPVGYLEMIQLEKFAAFSATHSGGVQKGAFFYEVPCVTLRNETQWVKLTEEGWNRLVRPIDAMAVRSEINSALGSRGREILPY